MLYNLGDMFLVDEVLCVVVYINNNKAWVAPKDEDIMRGLLPGLVFNVLDQRGRDKKGRKALPVVNKESQAV